MWVSSGHFRIFIIKVRRSGCAQETSDISSSDEDNQPLAAIIRKHKRSSSGAQLNVSIEEISPLPAKKRPTQQARNSSHTKGAVELTSSPYKNDLEKAKAGPSKARSVKKQLVRLKDTSLKNMKASASEEKEREKKVLTDSNNDDSCYCDICEEEKVIEMIQCMTCKKWYHAECVNISANIARSNFL